MRRYVMRIWTAAFVVALAGGAPVMLIAQSPRADSAVARADSLQRLRQAQANCDWAVELLGTLDPLGQVHPHGQGQTPSADAVHFADGWLLLCGARGGVTAASIIRTLRASPDTILLERFVGGFAAFRDSAVFNAALEVAGDRAASTPARIHAFRALFVLRTGEFWVGYPEMLAYDETGPGGPIASCGRGVNMADTAPSWYNGGPLPADFQRRIGQLASRVFRDTSEPLHVRSASRCAMHGS